MKKLLYVHPKIPKHCLIFLSEDTAFMVTVHMKGQRFLLQKTLQEASLKHFFFTLNSSLHPQSSFYRMNFNRYLFSFVPPDCFSFIVVCLCFHLHALSLLLHYEFSFYLLKVRATVHIFRIHGGVCGYRY